MFMVWAIPIGLALGLVAGGRVVGLAHLQFRWAPLAVLGLLGQVVLFDGAVTRSVGDLLPVLYVASNAIVLAAVFANVRLTGMWLVALGAGANLAAIVANGGYMPASAAAYAAQGRSTVEVYANTRLLTEPALAVLTDTIVLPAWLPFTNVASLGDVLIAAGVVVVLAAAMRRGRAIGPSPV